MASLSKSALIDEIASKTGDSKAQVDRFITALQDTVIDAVSDGKEVRLTGFAAFIPTLRPSRSMISPRTGEVLEVPEAKIVKIRPLKKFKDTVNNSAENDLK